MFKAGLVESTIRALDESGYLTVDCHGSRSSFDVIGKRGGKLLLVKALASVEGLSRDSVIELRRVASILGATAVVVSDRMKSSGLADGIVYDRYGVIVCSPATFGSIITDALPKIYSTRGNYCVRVDGGMLAQARRRLGMTQEDMAGRLRVTKQTVYRYEALGRASLDVFERLSDLFGEEIAEPVGEPRTEEPVEPEGAGRNVTSFKRMVCHEFEELGFKTSLTSAPFDMVASREETVFGVVSNDWRRLEGKLSVLEEISDLLGGYRVCVSERRVEGKVSVLTPGELAKVRSPRELFKLLRD